MQVRIGQKILETEERHRAEVEKLRESHATQSRAMQTQVHELKEHLARLLDKDEHELELAEAEAAGTRKGISFEERVHTAIEAIAGARGDVATHTGGERAEGGGKKGDTLIEIGACAGSSQGRIVFEAKDKRLSKNAAWAELNGAMEARAASFAVLVVAGEENLPSGREELTEYEGNKLIVAVDRDEPEGLGLAIAYRLAAARVAMARDRDLRGRRDRGPRHRRRGDQPAEAGAGDPLGDDRDQDQLRQGARRARFDGRGAGGEARADRRAGRRRGGRGRGGPLGQAELVLRALALGADDELRDPGAAAVGDLVVALLERDLQRAGAAGDDLVAGLVGRALEHQSLGPSGSGSRS